MSTFQPIPLPKGTFGTVLYTPELDDHGACGRPTKVDTASFEGKNVVIFAVPGAFTPTCHVNHLPPYVKGFDEFKSKGVDIIACIAANDPFVLSGWARVEGVKEQILFLSDDAAKWSEQLGKDLKQEGYSVDLSSHGLGTRTGRYAIIVNKEGKVVYAEAEPNPGAVSVSGADSVLSQIDRLKGEGKL